MSSLPPAFHTPLTKALGIRYPIMCAGMGHVTGAELAAAVSNAGGIGTIGAIAMSPEGMRAEIKKLKSLLKKGNSISGTIPYGVDLLLPQIGGKARKTNKDYTNGALEGLVQVMIDEKVPLFVCAVGIPPQWVVDKLHAQGTLVMNMAGHPKHVKKALSVGVDIICATGGEGGAHSGDISTLVLLPQCADLCKGKAILVGGGGVFDGRGIAACMSLGAAGVWVGTRFLASPEANSTKGNLDAILKATSADTRRIEIYSGRPLRVIKNAMNDYWEENVTERKALLAKGVIPVHKLVKDGEWAPGKPLPRRAFFGPPPIDGHWNDVRNKYDDWDNDFDLTQAGQCVGAIDHVAPAASIVQEMMLSLIETLQGHAELVSQVSKL